MSDSIILCPYEWKELVPGNGVFTHSLPVGVTSSLDPRPLSECATAAQGTRNAVMLLKDGAPLPNGAVQIAVDFEETLTAANRLRLRNAFSSQTPVSSTRLGDILHELWTLQADVQQTRCAGPLLPTDQMRFELLFGKQSQYRQFAIGGPEWPQVQARMRADYRQLRLQVLQGDAPVGLHRKALGFWLRKFRLQDSDFRLFVPDDLPDEGGPLIPTTTLSDDFNTADSGVLGHLLTWTEYRNGSVQNAFDNASNAAACNDATGTNSARAESDLSGTDHFAQVNTITLTNPGSDNNQTGPCCRFSSGAQTLYASRTIALLGELRLIKIVGGTGTDLNTTSSITYTGLPKTHKFTVSGTSLVDVFNGVTCNSITDSSITTGTRCGIWGFAGSGAVVDDFTASDVAAAATVKQLAALGVG